MIQDFLELRHWYDYFFLGICVLSILGLVGIQLLIIANKRDRDEGDFHQHE